MLGLSKEMFEVHEPDVAALNVVHNQTLLVSFDLFTLASLALSILINRSARSLRLRFVYSDARCIALPHN